MKSRKSTPDIMSNLMLNQASLIFDEQDNLQTVDIANNKAIIEKVFGGVIVDNHKAMQPDSNKTVNNFTQLTIKEKTTFLNVSCKTFSISCFYFLSIFLACKII